MFDVRKFENGLRSEGVSRTKAAQIAADFKEKYDQQQGDSPALTSAIDDLGVAFSEFKSANDHRLDNLSDRFDSIEAKAGRLPGGGGFNSTGKVDSEYKSALSEYWRRGVGGISSDIKDTLTTQSDPDGGYFVPEDTNGRIAEKVFESSPMRQLATIEEARSSVLEGLADNDEASAGWVGEEGTRSETDSPQSGNWKIPVQEMYAQPKATSKILEDGKFNVEEWLINKITKRFIRLENTAFVLGDGALKPRGLLSYTTVNTSDSTRAWGEMQYIASGAAGAFAASNPADQLFDFVFSLKADYLPNASWLMARTTLATIAKFKDGNGNYLLTMGNIKDKTAFTLLGYPVYLAEDMPAIAANSLSIAFGDFREAYEIADRLRVSVLRDPYTEKGFVKFYARKRVGGGVINSEAMKFMKFSES